MKVDQLSEEAKTLLLGLLDQYEQEDSFIRMRQIRLWKRNESFWHGLQYLFWSETNSAWLSPFQFNQPSSGERSGADEPVYQYVINIYRAHGESIISALSAQIPNVHFPPEDAENEADLAASKTYSKIADLIQKHNSGKLILLQCLFNLYNHGICFAYHPPKADESFGQVQVPVLGKVQRPIGPDQNQCASCGYVAQGPEETNCPDCGEQLNSVPAPTEEVEEQVGTEEVNQRRVCIDIFGPLHVKIPYYNRRQKDIKYLLHSSDEDIAFLKSQYPDFADKIGPNDDGDQSERYGRAPNAYASWDRLEERRYLATKRNCWIRSWALDGLPEDKANVVAELKGFFPKGIFITAIGKVLVDVRSENLDRYWTICKAGLSTYIHSDPMGQPVISIQEAINQLTNLTQETIEHGIPSWWADPEVVNFDTYSKQEARPGVMYPATPAPGKGMADAFFEAGRATLSKEVQTFRQKLDEDAQFVLGSFPSIYGGPSMGKSRTLGEYAQSRQQAIQRLSICWSFVTSWWQDLIDKCVKIYVDTMLGDEKYVQKQNDNYVNVWIRQQDLYGKVGQVAAESSEAFPISAAQKQDLLLKLMEMNIDEIKAAVFDPSNRRLISEALSFPELAIPGEDQRIKQAREIQQLLREMPGPQGPSVPIEPETDDDEMHIFECRYFLVSAEGLDAKRTIPEGYMNVKLHLQMHVQNQQQKMLAQQPQENNNEPARVSNQPS